MKRSRAYTITAHSVHFRRLPQKFGAAPREGEPFSEAYVPSMQIDGRLSKAGPTDCY